ncbi:hypothetical protein RHDE110596_12895 [Prescottella defluvii]|nr:hypothetical protein [Prescottella defluvii]
MTERGETVSFEQRGRRPTHPDRGRLPGSPGPGGGALQMKIFYASALTELGGEPQGIHRAMI